MLNNNLREFNQYQQTIVSSDVYQKIIEQQKKLKEEALKLTYPPEAPEWSNNAAKHIISYLADVGLDHYTMIVSSTNLQEKLDKLSEYCMGTTRNILHSWGLTNTSVESSNKKVNIAPIPGVMITGLTIDMMFTIIKKENNGKYHFYRSVKEDSGNYVVKKSSISKDHDLEKIFTVEVYKLKEILITNDLQKIEETLVSIIIDKYWRGLK